VELKERIGEILKDCPDDLRSIGDVDFKTVDRSDVEHFELSVRQLIHPRVGRRLAPRQFRSSACSSRTSPLRRS
jgi:hypothetical protein